MRVEASSPNPVFTPYTVRPESMTFSSTRRDAATFLKVEAGRTAARPPETMENKSSSRRLEAPSLNELKGKGDRLPAAEADAGQSSFPAANLQGIEQRHENPRARSAERMPQRDGAA